MDELDYFTVGRIFDLFVEQHNDRENWPIKGNGAMMRQNFMH